CRPIRSPSATYRSSRAPRPAVPAGMCRRNSSSTRLSSRSSLSERQGLSFTYFFIFEANMPTRFISPVAGILVALFLAGCGSSEVTVNLSAEARFEMGKKKFDQGDYLEAIADFEIIKLQYPGSGVADDAQYYLAESHFKREEYLL